MQILNFGSCNIDCVYSVHHMVKPGETIAAGAMNRYAGGKGLNQSIALARAGARPFHAGCVGSDAEMLRSLMLESGVDLTYLQTVTQQTGHAIIQVEPSGENSILIYGGANAAVTRPFVDEVLSHFAPGDILLLQNEISELPYIIEQASRRGMRLFLNPSPFHEDLKALDLNLLHCLILNEIEAAQLSGLTETEAFIQWMKEHYPTLRVILTLGKRGSIYFDESQRIQQPAFRVKAVDTTAAGDTFTGYFTACLCKGYSVAAALKFASAASAISVSRQGAAPSIPTMEQVKQALPSLETRVVDDTEQKQAAVQHYFETHLQDASLSDLSKMLGYAPSYAGRWLKKQIGAPFCELLLRARCKKVAEYLIATDLPVTECIALAGYKNETFFRQEFVKLYGCTPSKYRKKEIG